MASKPARPRSALGLAAALALTAGPGAAQSNPPAGTPPSAEPVVVAEQAPQGGSRDIAMGGAIGILIGLTAILLIASTASAD